MTVNITHLYKSEEETVLYLLTDMEDNKMTIHNEKSLVVYLNKEWENLKILESKEWNCYESSATIQNVKTIDDIFELCNLFKRSEMIPNQKYPTEFVNMEYDLHIRRIL
jgi:hypothetical protein|tara:strand:+ start:79 stop:405 length:327 start_codon:yes stop_codon:yes gene_type:complete